MFEKISKKPLRLFSMLLTLAMLMSMLPSVAFAEDSTGETEESTFIEVSTIEDLYNIRLDLTANYKLMNDIDLTEATASGGEWDFGGRGWNPIGSNDIYADGAFSGIFDGNGYSIIGMRINVTSLPSEASTGYAGLFANVTGEVRNLTMKNVTIYDNKCYYLGGIAAYNSGTITNCAVSGKIESKKKVNTPSQIFNNTGSIAAYNASTGVITKSVNKAEVYSCYVAGGIAGSNYGTINKCYNAADIYAESSFTGTNSKGTANWYSTAYGGGVAGYESGSSALISDCYNSGAIVGTQSSSSGTYLYIGGISSNGTNVIRCYNAGKTTKKLSIGNAIANKANDSYFLSGTGTQTTGTTALTETQMKLQSMYVGFDFENVWIQNPNALYPYPQLRENIQEIREIDKVEFTKLPDKMAYFRGEVLDLTGCEIGVYYTNGDCDLITVTDDMVTGFDPKKIGEQTLTVTHLYGTLSFTVTVENKPFKEIRTIKDLYNIRLDPTSNYRLMNDIDLTEATAEGGEWDQGGNGWDPTPEFSGIFDGNGYKIIGMRINSSDSDLGLFSKITDGEVRDLTFDGGSIYGTALEANAGALAATISDSVITNVSSDLDSIALPVKNYSN